METETRSPSDQDLTDEQGLLLLALARETLEEAVGRTEPTGTAVPDEAWLLRRAATFVTLTQGGARPATGRAAGAEPRLRGCIGAIRPVRPLIDDLRHNTRAAALRDPRFPPLSLEELERDPVAIGVSVLSPLTRIEPRSQTRIDAVSEADLLARLRPGVDGVVLEWGRLCGTYLPQVWRHFPQPADFLASLKAKAGLPADFWSPDLGIWTFTVHSWSEEAPG